MNRLILILFFVLAIPEASFGQKPKPLEPIKRADSTKVELTDSLFLANFAKLSGDSILFIVDSLLKDSSFLNSLNITSLQDAGEFASVKYKIEFPKTALGWVNDYEKIFLTNQVAELDSIISNFEKETTNEIAIVTIDSSSITKEEFDSLILAIGRNWGVGKREKNNGIVIGISAGLRKIRICNGYGIEAKLTDSETKKIIDEIMIPRYKEGDYFEGTKQGLFALMQKIR